MRQRTRGGVAGPTKLPDVPEENRAMTVSQRRETSRNTGAEGSPQRAPCVAEKCANTDALFQRAEVSAAVDMKSLDTAPRGWREVGEEDEARQGRAVWKMRRAHLDGGRTLTLDEKNVVLYRHRAGVIEERRR